jgi:hypothetical protein
LDIYIRVVNGKALVKNDDKKEEDTCQDDIKLGVSNVDIFILGFVVNTIRRATSSSLEKDHKNIFCSLIKFASQPLQLWNLGW